jgi:hypothetical protein
MGSSLFYAPKWSISISFFQVFCTSQPASFSFLSLCVSHSLDANPSPSGVSHPQAALSRLRNESVPGDGSGFRASRRPMFGRTAYILALQKPAQPGVFTVCRPATGTSFFEMERDELDQKYAPCSTPEDAQEGWTEGYEAALLGCGHGAGCAQGAACTVRG